MPENKSYQLAKVAKELNVGLIHLVEKLHESGYVEVENKPSTKISAEMYDLLGKHFAADKAHKMQADKVQLRTNVRPEDEFDFSTPVVETTTPVVVEVTPEPEKPIEEPAQEEKPEPVQLKMELEPEPTETAEPTETTEKLIRTQVNLDGPKVLDKIDLDADKKKKEEARKSKQKAEQEKSATAKTEEKPAKKVERKEDPIPEKKAEPVVIVKEPVPIVKAEDVKPEMIERKKVTLAGPTFTGEKIDLSKIKEDSNRKPFDAKRERKKINKSKPINIEVEAKKQTPKDDPNKPKTETKKFENNRQGGGGGGYKGGQQNRTGGHSPNYKGNKTQRTDEVISEDEIQNKIKETMAKLAGNVGGNRPKVKPKSKHSAEEEDDTTSHIIEVTEYITVSELASLMNIQPTEIIMSCFKLGVIVSINQRIDAEIIELVSEEFGFTVKFLTIEQQEDRDENDEEEDDDNLLPRAPIVTIMGHVDHGKTSLLDYIRSANVVGGEMGGITQHIGAYEVVLPDGREITFLDTPGHEAFTAMRARGAKLTDIAVIVIAADDAIMPQTREAISHAQAASVPIIIAINKIDKDGANPERIKEQLANLNILVEDWGGKVQSQEISAKKGINIDKLLDKILLESELLDLKANPNRKAVGSVIEASLDKGRGYVSNIMVQNGTLRQGDLMVAGSYFGRVKAMFDQRGQRIQEAGPSTPVGVLGLLGAPQAGDKLKVYETESEAKEVANKRQQLQRELGIRAHKHITLDEIGRRLALGNFKELKLIVKGDVDGSVEALSDSLIKLSTESILISVINKAVGQISETDVMLASASDAIIIGFNVRPSLSARKLAENEDIEIRTYSIIYDAIEEVKSAMEGLMEPKMEEKIVCHVEIREVFKIGKLGTIAGCYVQDGKITRNTKVRVIRDGIILHTGELASLKRFKDDVKEVGVQMECGLNIKGFNDIEIGDAIEGFEEVQVKVKL